MQTHSRLRRHGAHGVLAFAGFLLWGAGASLADDPPDLEMNPVSGWVEAVDTSPGSGDRVRHVVDKGRSSTVALVSDGPGESPRLSIDAEGDSWVVWWQPGVPDAVLCAVRDGADGTWGTPWLVSQVDEVARNPEIAQFAGTAWIAYEVSTAAGGAVIVAGINDDPEPMTRTSLASTEHGGALDVSIQSEAGHLWVTWIDDAATVGWSERVDGAWTLPQYEWADDSLAEARKRIGSAVTGF